MRVQDLQEFLAKFTEGSDAIKNAHIFVEVSGKLAEVKRMEVHESQIIGSPSIKLVVKTQDEKHLTIDEGLKGNY